MTTYTVLYRLQREGLLEKDDSGLYRVTSQGVELFREALGFLKELVGGLEASLPSN